MSRENVKVVRRIYEAWGRTPEEAVAAVMELFAPDAEWSAPHPDAARLQGRDEVARWVASYAEHFEDFRHVPEELRALPDGRVLALFIETGRGRQSGARTRVDGAAIWTLSQGKVTRFEAFTDRNEALEAVGLRE